MYEGFEKVRNSLSLKKLVEYVHLGFKDISTGLMMKCSTNI